MTEEEEETEGLGDHAQLTRRMMREFQGLMLSRTVPETIVVSAAVGTAIVTDDVVVGPEVEVTAEAEAEVASESSNEGGL